VRRVRREIVGVDAVNALIELALLSAADPAEPPPPGQESAARARKRLLAGHGRRPWNRIRIYRSGIGWRRLPAAPDFRA
jgi:hypothetical protein